MSVTDIIKRFDQNFENFDIYSSSQRAQLIIHNDDGTREFQLDFQIRNKTVRRIIFREKTPTTKIIVSKKTSKLIKTTTTVPTTTQKNQNNTFVRCNRCVIKFQILVSESTE